MELSALRKTESLEVWMPFGEDAEVLISFVPRDESQELYRKASVTKFVKHEKKEVIDRPLFDRLLGRRAVKNWRPAEDRPGFTMDGQPLQFTPENCDLLMNGWSDFAAFVDNTCTDLPALLARQKELKEKAARETQPAAG